MGEVRRFMTHAPRSARVVFYWREVVTQARKEIARANAEFWPK
jgi:hypothetical protein